MVIWVFAGGGQSEIAGLVPFLNRHFNGCHFERRTPVIKKIGPKPGVKSKGVGLGKTGCDLSRQIAKELDVALRFGGCELILVVDDLDCCCKEERRNLFLETINKIPGAASIPQVIALAAPEIESWIIADWDNTVAKHVDFRSCGKAMKHWLIKEKKIPFAAPESFGEYDPKTKSCTKKLSDLIIEASVEYGNGYCYSKGTHTPRLLQEINPKTVAKKCPLFKSFFLEVIDATKTGK